MQRIAICLLGLALLALPAASAQGQQGFGRGLPGIAITGGVATLDLAPGATGTLTFHVAHSGNATLDVLFFARDGAAFRGRNGTGPPPGFTGGPRNGTGGPRTGTRQGGRGAGFNVNATRGGSNLTVTADPPQVTLLPEDSGDVTLTVRVATSAVPGSDHTVLFIVRASSGGGVAVQSFTVHVSSAGAAKGAPSTGVAVVLATLFLAATRRRHA